MSSPCSVEKLASLQCGGGGLGMATCAAWGSDCATPAGSRLAVVGADGGLRVVSVAETGDLRVTQEATDAHSLEAWAVAFATKDAFHGSGRDVVFSGADDAQLKAWDVRAGLELEGKAGGDVAVGERQVQGIGEAPAGQFDPAEEIAETGAQDREEIQIANEYFSFSVLPS